MENKIKILSEMLINQIAAGEVVERPASVVKELLENAVDAGATEIRVEIQEAGTSQILVTDNGQGMTLEDLSLSIERHATSKIKGLNDLYGLRTMGFRGEALPSIAAVSRLSIRSIPRGADSGHRLEIWGGEKKGLVEIAGIAGTTVEVNDLFYHTPARLAFLKSLRAEWGRIHSAFERVALGFPEIQMTLLHNGKKVIHLLPTKQRAFRLEELWGKERTSGLIGAEGEEFKIRVQGFISPPQVHLNTGRYVALIVNRRWVRSPLIYPLLFRSYQGLLPQGRFPLAALWMEVPPELVDVNIHPAKQEVRFSHEEWVLEGIRKALGRALKNLTPPEVNSRPAYLAPFREAASEELPILREPQAALVSPAAFSASRPGQGSRPEADRASEAAPNLSRRPVDGETGPFSGLFLLGQVYRSYLLAVGESGLLVVDQHAAHERVLYEKLLQGRRRDRVVSQLLLTPLVLELAPADPETVESLESGLRALGFDWVPGKAPSYRITAIPQELSPAQAAEAVQEIFEIVTSGRETTDHPDQAERLLKTLACHGAIKAGQSLTEAEMRSLLGELDRTEQPSHCPHGRPLWFLLSLDEIERRLKRK
jgi:DNA mismatch repair protein MutL